MSGSICAEEFERALVDAMAAIDGDRSARNRTVGRLMAVRAHLHRPTRIDINRATAVPSDREAETTVTRAAVATIEERTAA